MAVTLKALPVVYACQGCAEYGQSARDLGAELEQRGIIVDQSCVLARC